MRKKGLLEQNGIKEIIAADYLHIYLQLQLFQVYRNKIYKTDFCKLLKFNGTVFVTDHQYRASDCIGKYMSKI